MHSANCNLASNYDRNIILSLLSRQCSPLSHHVNTSISEFPTYASFGVGGHIGFLSPMHKKIPDSYSKREGGNPGNSGLSSQQ